MCDSPLGFCTLGELRGRLRGDYDFSMNSLIPSGDSSIPWISFLTGTSLITLAGSGDTLVGTDACSFDLNPFGFGRISSLIPSTSGTGILEGAQFYLHIRGGMDFVTGGAQGDYQGKICFAQINQ